jgi:hypothetical protein
MCAAMQCLSLPLDLQLQVTIGLLRFLQLKHELLLRLLLHLKFPGRLLELVLYLP